MARISELHYSNAYAKATGVHEFLEVALPAGADPADYTVAFYQANGHAGFTVSLDHPGVEVYHDADTNEDVYVISNAHFPILLTDPDGGGHNNYEAYALVDNTDGTVIDFYDIGGGTRNITALDGPAAGATSVNIPVPVGPKHINASIQFNKPDPDTATLGCVSPGDTGVICFARGTCLATPGGEMPVEELRPGDLVETLDHGPQPLLWVGATSVPAQARLAPICIAPGVIGNRRELVVSPEHRVLLKGGRVEFLFGVSETLVAAKHLLDGRRVTRREGGRIEYFHVMFDRHQIVLAEGAPAESLFVCARSLALAGNAHAREILRLWPQLAHLRAFAQTARPVLRAHEARLLVA